MAYRRSGPSGTTPVQAENKKRLEDLLKRPENQICADCPERGPRWASATLGTFICIKCSGIHRNLGVHISFVRSVNLDEWKTEHVEQMEKWGNGRARAYFEAQVPPGYARPSDWSNVHQMTKWIKDKYEYKRFLPKDGSVPGREPAPSRASPTSNGPSPPSVPPTRERKPRARPSPSPSSLPASAPSSSSSSLPKPAPAPAPVVDLLDFTDPAPTPPPPSVPASLPPPAPSPVVPGPPASAPPPPPPTVEMTSSGKPKLTTDQLLSMFMSPAASQPQHKPGPYGQPLAQPVNPTLAQQPSAYGTVPSHPQHHPHYYQQHHHPHHYHQQQQQQQQLTQPQYQQQRPQYYQQQSQQQYQQHQHQQHYQQERPSNPFGHTGSAGAPTPNPQPHPQPGRWGLETMSTPVTAIQHSQPQHGQGGFGGTASGMPGSMLPPRPASLPPTGPGHALPSFPPSFPQQQPPWPAPSSQQQQPVWPPQPQQGGTGANGFAF